MKYLINHCGFYWKANSSGYSNRIGQAGIYNEKEANSIKRNERFPPDVLVQLDMDLIGELEENLYSVECELANLKEMIKQIRQDNQE